MKSGLTRRILNPSADTVEATATYIFGGSSTEARAHIPMWDEVRRRTPAQCAEIVEQNERDILVRVAATETRLVLTDVVGLRSLFTRTSAYIDLSGLAHHVWAPLLRAGLLAVDELEVVYVEPASYRPHPSPASNSLFDLSDGFRGIDPLPGFANLSGPPVEREAIFVPFLGFEGPRARFLAMSLDPVPRVVAVVGVPGFQMEFPQIAISSNQELLSDFQAHADIRLARASCPFEAYEVLQEIRRDNPEAYLYLAPVGTKPHALGAVWYAIDHPSHTELMYDHPRRKPKRTDGVGIAHFYRVKP